MPTSSNYVGWPDPVLLPTERQDLTVQLERLPL